MDIGGFEMETKSKTKLCKYCKTEIPKGAKICATCGKKQGGKLKWVIIVLVVLLLLSGGSGEEKNINTEDASLELETGDDTEATMEETETIKEKGNEIADSEPEVYKEGEKEVSDSDTKEMKEDETETSDCETEEVEVETKNTYIPYTVNQMMEDLNANAMKASSIYKDQNIEITGKLKNIDSSGAYISLYSDNEWDFIGVTCYLKNDEQREQVMNMSIGDTVTLKGKCTEVGEVLGYALNIESIN